MFPPKAAERKSIPKPVAFYFVCNLHPPILLMQTYTNINVVKGLPCRILRESIEMEHAFHNIRKDLMSMFSLVYKYPELESSCFRKLKLTPQILFVQPARVSCVE